MRGLVSLLVLAGCFKPSPLRGLACAPDGWCPDNEMCGADHVCYDPRSPGGDGGSDIDADAAPRNNLAFVTTDAYRFSELGSIAGANQKCQDLATVAGVKGTFVAWMSGGGVNAIAALAGYRGWVRRDNLPFVDSTNDLGNGSILYPLRIDLAGNDLGFVPVWTGTDAFGQQSVNCIDNAMTTIGVSDGGYVDWTQNTTLPCTASAHLYCFETGTDLPLLAPPAATDHFAFLSTLARPGHVGSAVFDGDCQSDAVVSGLVSDSAGIVAFVATTGPAIALRTPGTTLVRPDHVVWLPADSSTPLAPLEVDAAGRHVKALVWGGAVDPSAPPAANGTDNCDQFTNMTKTARSGSSSRSAPSDSFGAVVESCNTQVVNQDEVYCIQQ